MRSSAWRSTPGGSWGTAPPKGDDDAAAPEAPPDGAEAGAGAAVGRGTTMWTAAEGEGEGGGG